MCRPIHATAPRVTDTTFFVVARQKANTAYNTEHSKWALSSQIDKGTHVRSLLHNPNTNPKQCLSAWFTHPSGSRFHSIVTCTRAYTSGLAQLALFLIVYTYIRYRGTGMWEYGHPYALRTSQE